jgi:hypothetical protein
MPLNQTEAAKEKIGRLQQARSKKREKESAEDFKKTFGEDWRNRNIGLLPWFSDEFGDVRYI